MSTAFPRVGIVQFVVFVLIVFCGFPLAEAGAAKKKKRAKIWMGWTGLKCDVCEKLITPVAPRLFEKWSHKRKVEKQKQSERLREKEQSFLPELKSRVCNESRLREKEQSFLPELKSRACNESRLREKEQSFLPELKSRVCNESRIFSSPGVAEPGVRQE